MAKPEHTAYQIQVDSDGNRDILAMDDNCIRNGQLQIRPVSMHRGFKKRVVFSSLADGHISFGYKETEKLLSQVRVAAKVDFSKGDRPRFFLKKLTMSEFMSHKNFKHYKDVPLVKSIFKKYLLLDLLK